MPYSPRRDKVTKHTKNLFSLLRVAVSQWLISEELRAALRAACRKALTAQNRPAGLGLEGHAIALAALIAYNFEAFAFAAASAAALSLAAKILATRIPARLAAFRMGQSAFAIIILLSFSKRESISALRTSDFEIWHGLLP